MIYKKFNLSAKCERQYLALNVAVPYDLYGVNLLWIIF